MTSGGAETEPTTTNPSMHSIKRNETEPSYEKTKISLAKVARQDTKTLTISWEVDETKMQPFSYHFQILDNKAGAASRSRLNRAKFHMPDRRLSTYLRSS